MKRTMVIIFSVLMLVNHTGCAKRGSLKNDEPPVTSVAVKEEKKPIPPEPLPEKPIVGIEGKKGSYDGFTRPARRFTIALKNADLREVLFSLSKEDSFQLILDPGVTGSVTLDMKDVTAFEVVYEVCRANDLYCTVEEDVVRVRRREHTTRVFYLDYVITNRSGSGNLTASTSTGTSDGTGSGVSVSSAGGDEGESDSINEVTTNERMNVWGVLEANIRMFLSGEESKVSISPETGMVAVTDYPENIDLLEDYLLIVESRLREQVLIEAKILEVSLNDSNRYGIDWSAIVDLSGIGLSGSLSGGATMEQNLSSGATAFQFGVSDSRVDLFLDAVAEQGQVNVLSTPKISTLNNQKAIIRIGTQDVFFQSVVIPATTTTAPVTTFSPQTITEGIILSVTPQVGRDGRVTLAIHPSISEKTGEAVAPDGNTAPIIEIREANTILNVRDGETVFIGGLMQDRVTERVRSVPFLGDIPFLGALFRNTVQEKRKSELVILLTPHVLRTSNMSSIVEEEAMRIQRSKRGYHIGARPWLYGTQGERALKW
ncbi:MAG: secretin N-terminal domain-containing protein [Deltaproteobacteria bacterium]|nr:secretin N-terminal domain-containing protein [Deltaproteobacteria bacterium]